MLEELFDGGFLGDFVNNGACDEDNEDSNRGDFSRDTEKKPEQKHADKSERLGGSKIEAIRKKKTDHGQHSEDIIMNIREAIHENFAGFKKHKENKKSKIN